MGKSSIVVLMGLLVVSACSQQPERQEIAEVRRADPAERESMPSFDTATRMGVQDVEGALPEAPPPPQDVPPAEEPPTPATSTIPEMPGGVPQLMWEVPAGWEEAGERPMRLVTFHPEGTEHTECFVTFLVGPAGGIVANVNRWRAQLGLGPLTEDNVAALPRLEMLGEEAVFVNIKDLSGTQEMYGVICPVPEGLLFVRMVGLVEEMEAERERFEAFCRSIQFVDAE